MWRGKGEEIGIVLAVVFREVVSNYVLFCVMENVGYIEITISGSKGNLELSPEHYDIREIIDILENVENLLFPREKKGRPTITYSIEPGSVRNIFKTALQSVIAFNAIIGQIAERQNIDFLELQTATALENIQNLALRNNYTYKIRTSLTNSHEVRIDSTTSFKKSESIWAEAEFYFYGKVTNAGGKNKANIHLSTHDLGTVIIHTPMTFLEEYEDNLLYKFLGVRAVGKQHSMTGEIDTSSLSFVELIHYQPTYDEGYLKGLRDKAKQSWLGTIDADAWLSELRGGYGT